MSMLHTSGPAFAARGTLPRLQISAFTAGETTAYARWDAMRREIFAGELGWALPPAPGPNGYGDPFDRCARFVSATHGDVFVGIARALSAVYALPHRELFEPHLRATRFDARLPQVGTINAVAVVPRQRHVRFAAGADGTTLTASQLIVRTCLDLLAADGVRVVFATVLSATSARVFLRAGFRLLDEPFAYAGDDRFRLMNVGRILTVAGEPPDPTARAAAAYFERCHRQVTALGSLDALMAPNR
jgi:hypothetical protein